MSLQIRFKSKIICIKLILDWIVLNSRNRCYDIDCSYDLSAGSNRRRHYATDSYIVSSWLSKWNFWAIYLFILCQRVINWSARSTFALGYHSSQRRLDKFSSDLKIGDKSWDISLSLDKWAPCARSIWERGPSGLKVLIHKMKGPKLVYLWLP